MMPVTLRRRLPGLAAMTLAGLLLFVAAAADAQPLRRIGQNPRGLALGGTGTSYADDEMGLYYNPAGLGVVENWWIELLPVALEASPDGQEFIQDKLEEGDSDVGSLSGVADLIEDNIGKDLHFRVFAYPTAVINLSKGWTLGLGGYQETEVDMLFSNLATPEADAYYRQDQGVAGALSIPLSQGRFILGLGFRTIDRTVGEGVITSAELAIAAANDELDLEESLDVQSGTGTGYDLGLIWRVESFSSLRSQFSISAQNIGGVDLGDAGEIFPEYSVGWAARPQFSKLIGGLFAVEYRDATNELSEDTSAGKRTHVGLELGIVRMDHATHLFTVRTGYGSGVFSWGVELAAWHSFSIQYVEYGQEYGEAIGDDPRDRRILQINFLGF